MTEQYVRDNYERIASVTSQILTPAERVASQAVVARTSKGMPILQALDPENDLVWARNARDGGQAPFAYHFSGQDISIFIDGVEKAQCELPIMDFAFNIQQQKQPVYGFWSYCVDAETEALTRRGWVSGSDLCEDDIILSMDPSNQELKWSEIKSIYLNYDYDDRMHYVTNKNIDALVTPGHKFALATGELKPIEEIRKKDRIVSMGTALENSSEIYTDVFVELVGWFVTEGHIRKDVRAIEISQSARINSDYCDRIELCLKRLDVKYSRFQRKESEVYKYYLGVKNPVVDQLLKVAPNRVLSYEFLSAISSSQRSLLLETMIDGDGSRSEINGTQYAQKDMAHIDSFMALCALSGISTCLSKKRNGCFVVTLKNRRINEGYSLDFHGGYVDGRYNTQINNTNPSQHIPTVEYRGLVWCPETEYGTFVCRRNGKVYVTGNTHDAIMRGTRIVTGQFRVAAVSPGYMTNLLSKAAEARVKKTMALSRIRGLDIDEANIEKYWTRTVDPQTLGYKHLFSSHPPFNFVVVYGMETTSITNDPTGRLSELSAMYQKQGPLMADFNERLVEADPEGSMRIIVESVELNAMQTEYTTDGQVVAETYSFFARDLVNVN